MKLLLLLLLTVTFCVHHSHQQPARIARECSDVYRDLGGLRLSGSQHNTEGVVEVCYQSTSQSPLEWGVVCAETENWANENANVVCRQLGFADQESTAASVSMTSTQPYFLGSVFCTGFEKTLVDCHADKGTVACTNSQIAFVTCNPAPCNSGDVRVVGGDSETFGRVEVCLLGQWGSVQDDDWSISDAVVVCKQLGLDTSGSHTVSALSGIIYGRGTGPVHLNRVQCDESERKLIECPYSILTVCNTCRDVAVQCVGPIIPNPNISTPFTEPTTAVDTTTNYPATNEGTTARSVVANPMATSSNSPTELALVVLCVLLAISLLVVLAVCITQTIVHHRYKSTAAATESDEHPREGFTDAIDMPEYLELSPAPIDTVTMDIHVETSKPHYYEVPLFSVQQEGIEHYENMDMGGVTKEGGGPYYSVADRGEPRPYEIPTNTLTTAPEQILVDY